MVLVSPDGERSMNTYLGVSEFLAPADIDEAQMAAAESIFSRATATTGNSIAAFEKAVRAAKRAGGKVAITLSDPFCVERHRDEFLRMMRADVDLLVANEHELMSLYQTGNLGAAMAGRGRRCRSPPAPSAPRRAHPRPASAGARAGHRSRSSTRPGRATSSPPVPARPDHRARLADLCAHGLPRGRRGDQPRRRAARGGPARLFADAGLS